MLKYIVILYTISGCHSMPRSQVDNRVRQVVFTQRSPVTEFEILKEVLLQDGVGTIEDVINFLRQYTMTLTGMNPNRFIIYTIAGFDSSNEVMEECKDDHGNARKYEYSPLTNEFENNLKNYWPSRLDNVESAIWKMSYDKHGSCINDSPLSYYQNAIRLHNNYNAGELLRRASIGAGARIYYDDLINALVSELGGLPVITCRRIENARSDAQFIYEVSICLNTSYQVVDCHSRPHNCALNEHILYPTWEDAER